MKLSVPLWFWRINTRIPGKFLITIYLLQLVSSNLNLKPRDMAKFGQMLLNHGKWQNNKVVDSIWVHEATKPHYTSDGWAYGYYFWIYPGENVYWAAGHGGQTIMVAPDKNLVAVVTAWPYVQDNEKWKDNFEFNLYKQILESCK